MVSRNRFGLLRRAVWGVCLAICLAACAGLAAAARAAQSSGAQVPAVDTTGINMAAQDATGVVWAATPNQVGGLYSWQDNHWALATVQMPSGGVPVGVWNGLDGGVIVVWELVGPGAQFTWYRGTKYKVLGELEGGMANFQVFTSPPDNIWITNDTPKIYRLKPGGRIEMVYSFEPQQFYSYHHAPNQEDIYCEFDATAGGQGHTWFWSNASGEYINAAVLGGFLIYDGRSFQFHPSMDGLPPGAVSFLGREDQKHLWAGVIDEGLYSIDTVRMTAQRVAQPPPPAFSRITKVFEIGKDVYVVAEPHGLMVAETSEHRFTAGLWRLHEGRWQEVLRGIDDIPDPTEGLRRPWIATSEGLWLGAHAAGLWLIPSHGDAPRLINWRQGLPMDSVDRLYKIGDHKLLAVDISPARAAVIDTGLPRASVQAPESIQVMNPFSPLESDQRQHLWGILNVHEHALAEWDGQKWLAHPLPGNVNGSWISNVDADSRGRIWLFPDCRQGPAAVFDPVRGNWTGFRNYQAALESSAHPVTFLNAAQDNMKPIYGLRSQIAFMGACNGINYFDGNRWRLWNRPDMPVNSSYFFDGPAFFDSAGNLAVNIHRETWEFTQPQGWHLIPYEAHSGRLVRWFVPSPPASPPPGCDAHQSTSLARDRLGRDWWTWQGSVYEGVPGLCRQALSSAQPQPFIDGRLLPRVLIDARGNQVFETVLANQKVGEYVILTSPEIFPRTSVRLTQLSPDSVRLDFSSTASGKTLYRWRINDGDWSAPQEQPFAVIPSIPGGEHRIEAESIDSDLQIDPVPASVSFGARAKPHQQIADLIARLEHATSDDERESVLKIIEQPPPAVVLPALKAARAQATGEQQWWIDAAIQQIESGQSH